MLVRGLGLLVVVGALVALGGFLGYGQGLEAGAAREADGVVRNYGFFGGAIVFKFFLVFLLLLFISKFVFFWGWGRRHGWAYGRGREGWSESWRERHERWHHELEGGSPKDADGEGRAQR